MTVQSFLVANIKQFYTLKIEFNDTFVSIKRIKAEKKTAMLLLNGSMTVHTL